MAPAVRGEQQRLAFALALVGRPEVLFLDEPTAGVDPEGRLLVRDLVAAQRDRGGCVLLTTHELAEAERLADRVVIVDHGRKLADGTPASLAAGTSDGSIRFTSEPGLDAASLLAAVGEGGALDEERPGAYRLRPPAGSTTPAIVAALAGWLWAHDRALGDLRTGHSLEDAYLAITGSTGGPEPDDPNGAAGGGAASGGRRRDRRGRGDAG